MPSASTSRSAESGFPVFQNVLELENDRRDAKKRLTTMPGRRHHPRRNGRLHPATQGVPERAAALDGRTALSRNGRRGADFFAAVPRPHGARFGQSEDETALLPRPLGLFRRHRQPAAGLYRDGGGFVEGHDHDACRFRRQAQPRRRDSAAGGGSAQPGASPPVRRFHATRIRPIRCRRRRSPPISTTISTTCTPSNCAASCSARSIRPASP